MKKTIIFLSALVLSGCATFTTSKVNIYDPTTGKKTQEIQVSPIMEWDAATQKVGADTKIVRAAQNSMNRAVDKMPEYLAEFMNKMKPAVKKEDQ